MSRFWSGFGVINGGSGDTDCPPYAAPALRSAVCPARDPVVDVGAIATSGAGATAISLTKVGPVGVLATAGAGVTAVTLRKLGVLAPVTAGVGSDAAALRMIGVLAPAFAGRSNLALVLTELGSLSAITAGRTSLAAQLVEIGVLTPATSGVGSTQVTLAAIRTFTLATAGQSDLALQLLGSHSLLTIATTGAGDTNAELTDAAAATPAPPLIGPIGTQGWSRVHRPRVPRAQPFALATRGSSTLVVALDAYRAPPMPPTETPRTLADPLEDWATTILLLEDAA